VTVLVLFPLRITSCFITGYTKFAFNAQSKPNAKATCAIAQSKDIIPAVFIIGEVGVSLILPFLSAHFAQ
jgi:hypothetical protein